MKPEFLNFGQDRKRMIRFVIIVGLCYTAFALAYSFVGFLHYEPGSHYHEYGLTKLGTEIGGHFLFGFIAALPLLDPWLMLLTGGLAVLIDSDHILSALNFDVSGRPDHSILFAIASTLFIIYISSRLSLPRKLRLKLAFVGTIVLLSHVSFDIFAAPAGTQFQFMIPFSFSLFNLSGISWLYFEVAAMLLSLAALLVSNRLGSRKVVEASHADESIVKQ